MRWEQHELPPNHKHRIHQTGYTMSEVSFSSILFTSSDNKSTRIAYNWIYWDLERAPTEINDLTSSGYVQLSHTQCEYTDNCVLNHHDKIKCSQQSWQHELHIGWNTKSKVELSIDYMTYILKLRMGLPPNNLSRRRASFSARICSHVGKFPSGADKSYTSDYAMYTTYVSFIWTTAFFQRCLKTVHSA